MNIPLTNEGVSRSTSTMASSTHQTRLKLAFFGIFGIQNLGNECTLQAILYNVREHLPTAELYGICSNPHDTSRRHNLKAVPISLQNFDWVRRRTRGLAKLPRILRRIPGELKDWFTAVSTLRGTDLVVITGTGILTDYMTTFSGFPYEVFRWTAAARIAGCPVSFVGVGVGPIYGRLSRWLITSALSLAHYRSYRDTLSKKRIKDNGFDSDKDPIFPDLAFSLPPTILPPRPYQPTGRRKVALGVMDHRDIHLWNSQQHEAQYSTYLETMCDFVLWLVKHNYAIRIIQGDSKHDPSTRAELKARVQRRGIRYDDSEIIDEDATTVEELLAQLADIDVVVSPRFHNLLLGLLLNIPAVSISYDPKNDSLMTGVGLGEYCQPWTDLNLQTLIHQFLELEEHSATVKPMIQQKVEEYRNLLEDQYDLLFGQFPSYVGALAHRDNSQL